MAQSYAPTPIKLAAYRDFSGGLNLRSDAFQLLPNESPDLLDVVVGDTGGFVQRLAVQPFGSAGVGGTITNVWAFGTPSVNQVVVAGNGHLYKGTGAAWTSIVAYTPPQKPRAAVFNNNLYIVGGAVAPIRWTGTAATNLTQSWNETIGGEGAADGNMPEARYICSHMGRVFIAYTTESGTDFPCRIRWSHTNFAEDWRQEDYIDIDVGRDGDVITGIVEFRDRLYIFKNSSISILTGYSTTNFAVTTISQDIGAVSQEAICVTDVGLFNFSWPQGVYLDRGNGPYPIFTKLFPLIRDDLIDAAHRSSICMGWVNQNLWCSIPYQSGGTYNTRTLVYNPWIYKNRYLRFLQGPWYMYSLAAGAYATLTQSSGPTLYLAAQANGQYVGELEQEASTDNWGGGSVNIASYFKTSWVDIGSPSIVKRWRHADFAMRAANTGTVLVEVRRDYDPSTVYKTFQITPTVTNLGLEWDDGTNTFGKWDDGTGTYGKWADNPVTAEAIVRGSSMGSARAVQLAFYAPAGQTWGVDSIGFKYIPKRLRG